MPFYSGQNGELEIGTKNTGSGAITFAPAGKVRSWQFTSNLTTLETTTLGDRDRTTIAGIRNASGTCDLYYYAVNPNDTTTNSASVLINRMVKASASGQGTEAEVVPMKFIINDGTPTKKLIQGDCLITSASMSMAVGEVLSASISFEFVGSPTEMTI